MFDITTYDFRSTSIRPCRILVLADVHSDFPIDFDSLDFDSFDFAAIPGDLFDNEKADTIPVMLTLERLAKRMSVVYSLGNHETSFVRFDLYRRMMQDVGVVVLENEAKVVGGVKWYGYTPGTSIEAPQDVKAAIVLCHRPLDYFDRLKGLQPALVLSGHEHGGQWRIFGRGVYAPQEGLCPKYSSGRVESMIVSRGVTNTANVCGISIPRFGNRSEVVVVEVKNK